MLTRVLKLLVFLFPIFLPSQAFWWRSSSTETPPSPQPTVMKQIPLTYFRTYTYQQPLTSNPIQFPLLSSTDYITNYNSLSNTPLFNPMMSVAPMSLSTNNEIPIEARPRKSYGNYNLVRSLGHLPATTTTTTTTSTTTTPEPPTTTTTTTEASTTVQVDTSSSSTATDSFDNGDSAYPAFNRKAFTNHFNINYNRPVYPYPEYSVHKANYFNNNEKHPGLPNVEFVHCMCPINIPNTGFPSGYQPMLPLAANPSNSILLAQGRTNTEADTSLDMPNMPLNVDLTAGAETSNLVDDLQTIKLNREQQDAVTSASHSVLT